MQYSYLTHDAVASFWFVLQNKARHVLTTRYHATGSLLRLTLLQDNTNGS